MEIIRRFGRSYLPDDLLTIGNKAYEWCRGIV
jgi:hypothetical protein